MFWNLFIFYVLVYLFGVFGICFGVVVAYFLGFFKEFKLSICFGSGLCICLYFGLVILFLFGGLVMLLVCLLLVWYPHACESMGGVWGGFGYWWEYIIIDFGGKSVFWVICENESSDA